MPFDGPETKTITATLRPVRIEYISGSKAGERVHYPARYAIDRQQRSPAMTTGGGCGAGSIGRGGPGGIGVRAAT